MADYYRPMERDAGAITRAPGPIVAYDFETSNIPCDDGTIEPRFLTVFGAGIDLAIRTESYASVEHAFAALWPMLPANTRLCAWNANRFDTRIQMEALVMHGAWDLATYVAKSGTLRGASVTRAGKTVSLIDGMAALGLQCSLKKFLEVFAPHEPKGVLDFSRESFDADNPAHVAYARQDSRALYYGLVEADRVLRNLTGMPLRMTIGALAIRAFASMLPAEVKILPCGRDRDTEIRDRCFRGGYVFTAGTFEGPAWSYDLNQAYAGAMRSARLPWGSMARTQREVPGKTGMYIGMLSRRSRAPVPYVVRDYDAQRPKAIEAWGDPIRTMLVDSEIQCLRRHGWTFDVQRGYVWEQWFHARSFVDRLERLRTRAEPGTPLHTIAKAIGNNAYGKTVERESAGSYLFTLDPPPNALPVHVLEDDAADDRLWFVPDERDSRRWYHRPQIGAVITAHVRVLVYDAIMTDPRAFLKADTDGVTFSRPNHALAIHPTRYGRWKIESAGERHIIIAKKVYWTQQKTAAKGLHTRDLTEADFRAWLQGKAPVQRQMQLQSWRVTLGPSWRVRVRAGTGGAGSREEAVRAEYEARMAIWQQFRTVRIVPAMIRVRGRWKVREEFIDVPGGYLLRNRKRPMTGETHGNLDTVADALGMDAGDLLDTLRTLRRPTLKALRAEA